MVIFLCSLLFLVQGARNVSPLQPSNPSTILNILNYHCHCIVTWHLLAANSKLVENFEPSSEYASNFCHDRKSALRPDDTRCHLFDSFVLLYCFQKKLMNHRVIQSSKICFTLPGVPKKYRRLLSNRAKPGLVVKISLILSRA